MRLNRVTLGLGTIIVNGVRGGPNRGPVKNPTSAQVASADKYGVDARWIKPNGRLDYPPHDGFVGTPKNTTLQPGTKIDRYGGDTGSYFAPARTSFSQRGLPSSSANSKYTQYEVLKPLPSRSGPTAPWFGQPGGGTRYKTQMTVQQLIDGKFIKPIR